MFLIKEIVLSVENELILLNMFEWRAVSVFFLQTFNPKMDNNVFGHRMFGRFVHKRFVLLKICRKYEQTSCLQLLLETTVVHFNCL